MIIISHDTRGLLLRIEHQPSVLITDAAAPTALGPAIEAVLASARQLTQARALGLVAGYAAAQGARAERRAQWQARQARARARAQAYGLLLGDEERE